MARRTVITAEPCGFCSGVRNALAMIEKKLKESTENIYILKGLIHNNGVAAELKKCGLELIVVSGDNTAAVKHCACTLGIEEFYAQLTPQNKLEKVKNQVIRHYIKQQMIS